jgi:integrase/recombinase XerD
VANHRCSVYVRSSSSKRERQPAGPNITYSPGTSFQIRYKDNDGRRVWKTLSATTYPEAVIQAKERELELFRRDSENYKISQRGITRIEPKPSFVEAVAEPPTPKVVVRDSLGAAIDAYLAKIKVMGQGTTLSCYTNLLKQFYVSATKSGTVARTIKSINEQDLVDFYSYLEKLGNSEVTRHCKLTIVQCVLRANKNHAALSTGYETKVVVSYRPDEIHRLFAVATDAEKLLFSFFLATGGREKEVACACWDQIDFVRRSFTIRQNPGFRTKTKKSRVIPLPAYLVELLKARMLSSKGSLLFPRKDGKPDDAMRAKLAKLHERAGMPRGPGLHKWRKTYATQLHRSGTDARSIQRLLGHASLLTTQRYIECDEDLSDRALEQADHTFARYA